MPESRIDLTQFTADMELLASLEDDCDVRHLDPIKTGEDADGSIHMALVRSERHPQRCPKCGVGPAGDGTGKVARHDWARFYCNHAEGECYRITWSQVKNELKADIKWAFDNCPGWRIATLAEVTARLEDVLGTLKAKSIVLSYDEHGIGIHSYSPVIKWDGHFYNTPTIAAVRAIAARGIRDD